MTYPGRAWTVVENGTEIRNVDATAAEDLRAIDPSKPNAFDGAFVVIDEERMAFRVAQATLRLQEELAEARALLNADGAFTAEEILGYEPRI